MSQTEIAMEDKTAPVRDRSVYSRLYYELNKEKIKQRKRENYNKKYKSDKPVGRPKGTTGSYKEKWIKQATEELLKNSQPKQEIVQ